MEKGFLPPKEVAGWRVTASDVLLFPQPGEAVSFIDFHECGFVVLASDFFHGILREYGVQLQHLPPNTMLQLAGFVVICEAFQGIEPNKDMFRWVFEVKTRKVHGSNGGVLALVGRMNL